MIDEKLLLYLFCVLRMEDDVDYCRLLIKNGGY